jgi:NAD-dependent histone deacetylase SIR2
VVAGAGISVSAGIPDFRSSHGLFNSLKGEHKLKSSGKLLFDASVYKDDHSTSSFHDMVRKLSKMSENAKPTAFHRFLARLSVEGRLLRLYTQNVDGLEGSLPPLASQVPLNHKAPWPQTIQLHGGLEKMMCQKCRHISDFEAHLFDGPTPPLCPECVAADALRTKHAGKRSHGVGKLRPRIVLYNEHNPDDEAIGAVTTADFRTRPDAVVVVGTSMKIPAVRRIVHEMCQIVRDRREGTTIWINRDPIPPGKDLENLWDLVVKGDSDEVARLAALREWDNPDVELVDYTTADLERVKSSQGQIEIVIPTSPKKAEKSDQDKPVQRILPSVEIQSMTPPRSQNDRSPRKSSEDTQTVSSSPLRIKLKVGERSKQAAAAQVKNPASTGRSIADVLGGKENSSKPDNKPKTSLNKKTKVTKIRASTNSQKPLTQQRISGKITKSTVSVEITQPYKKPAPEPLSPRRDSNETLIPPQKSGYSSVEVSPTPETPPSMGGEWRNGETISPTGRIPSDMVRLLN